MHFFWLSKHSIRGNQQHLREILANGEILMIQQDENEGEVSIPEDYLRHGVMPLLIEEIY